MFPIQKSDIAGQLREVRNLMRELHQPWIIEANLYVGVGRYALTFGGEEAPGWSDNALNATFTLSPGDDDTMCWSIADAFLFAVKTMNGASVAYP